LHIERVVNRHPAVLESAAVGVTDPVMEEKIKIVAVLRPGATLQPMDFYGWVKEKLPKFMVPRYIEFIRALP
jgi:crotonobetaine/carnitine-CoA ligase